MLLNERPNGCGLWLPEDKKANMWHGMEGKRLRLMATCLPPLFRQYLLIYLILYVLTYV